MRWALVIRLVVVADGMAMTLVAKRAMRAKRMKDNIFACVS